MTQFLLLAAITLGFAVLIGLLNEKLLHLTYEIALLLFSVLAGIILTVAVDATWTTTKEGLFAISQNNQETIDKLVTQEGDTTLLGRLLEGNTVQEQDIFFHIV